jgi:hypothetical protein
MQHLYDNSDFFLVFNHETRKIYIIHTFYKLLFEANRPQDKFPSYVYLGRGKVLKDSRQFVLREHLEYAEELVS